ncbi:MAG: phosphoglucomutase/phosphomannomutase family protein [Cyanobacteria bacterium]|nr:phosphoglucomutase/phosphomannomutase family protein [Cyanobacteriota bacterium]
MGHNIQFGTDGWRAVIADGFTVEALVHAVTAIATYINQTSLAKTLCPTTMVIGYDTRFLSEYFAQVAADTLNAYGIDVLLSEAFAPTPLIAYAVKAHKAAGALMITASHNPPEYTGVKFIPAYAGPASTSITEAVMRYVEEGHFPAPRVRGGMGKTTLFSAYPEYLAHLDTVIHWDVFRDALKLQKPPRILYDPMYGAGQLVLPRILADKAGWKDANALQCQHNHRDPLFGGHLPEPTAENLGELIHKLTQKPTEEPGWDLGIATDGDADRFGVVSAESGRCFSSNELMPLLFEYLSERDQWQARFPGAPVARTIATSHRIDRLASALGHRVIETPVGFKYLAEEMLSAPTEAPVLMAAEQSGGMSILGHIPEKDGILTNLLVLEMLLASQKAQHLADLPSIDSLLAAQDKKWGGPLFGVARNWSFPVKQRQRVMDALAGYTVGSPIADGLTIESIRVTDGIQWIFQKTTVNDTFNDMSWILFRPSGTEPLIRIYAESPEKYICQQLERFVDQLQASQVMA